MTGSQLREQTGCVRKVVDDVFFLLSLCLALVIVSGAVLAGLLYDARVPRTARVPALLHNGDTQARARATAHYYIHVQDSVSG